LLSDSIWTIIFEGVTIGSYSDRADGVQRRLAKLLSNPYKSFKGDDFFTTPPGGIAIPQLGRDDRSDAEALRQERAEFGTILQQIQKATDTGDAATAKRLRNEFDYLMKHLGQEAGLVKLTKEINEARKSEDFELVELLTAEFATKTEHLGKEGGKKRKHKPRCGSASADEKKYRAVCTAIDRYIDRLRNTKLIPEAACKLADHLDHSLQRGNGEFQYNPPRAYQAWNVSPI
jgi:hypothetical protein